MRIVAGAFRGRRLAAPKGRGVRPTADRLRESLFNILQHRAGTTLAGARVADIFAGTGAVGLEALSRGAAHVTFVEKSESSLDCLRRNIDMLGVADRCRVVTASARRLPPADAPYDLIFLDPPYRRGLAEPALESLLTAGWTGPDSLLVLETAADETVEVPPALATVERRQSGDTLLHFLTPVGA